MTKAKGSEIIPEVKPKAPAPVVDESEPSDSESAMLGLNPTPQKQWLPPKPRPAPIFDKSEPKDSEPAMLGLNPTPQKQWLPPKPRPALPAIDEIEPHDSEPAILGLNPKPQKQWPQQQLPKDKSRSLSTVREGRWHSDSISATISLAPAI